MIFHLIEDLKRFIPDDASPLSPAALRALVRGILSPGFEAVFVYRVFRSFHQRKIPAQPIRFLVERFVESTTGISIPVAAEFGPGLRIHHLGGIIVHPSVRVGKKCTLYHDVTLGTDGLSEDAPRIGDDVLIGAGARVLGGIRLGDRCRVGANAVVVHSFPDDSVLVGVPARNVRAGRADDGLSSSAGRG